MTGKKAGENSWTSQTAGKTVSGVAEKEAAAGQALSAAKTRAQKATAEEALESATAELAVVTEARQRRSDGGEFFLSFRSRLVPFARALQCSW